MHEHLKGTSLKPPLHIAQELYQLTMELLRMHPEDEDLKKDHLYAREILHEVWRDYHEGEIIF